MGTNSNTYSGTDWIGETRHAFCIGMVRHFQAKHREALDAGDCLKAAESELCGLKFLQETQNLCKDAEPKTIVSDAEAARLAREEVERSQAQEAAAALKRARRRLEPRANPSAYKPYSGGLPTLGKHR